MQTRKDAEIAGWVGCVVPSSVAPREHGRNNRGVGARHVVVPALVAGERGVVGVVGRCSSVLRCGQGRACGLAPCGATPVGARLTSSPHSALEQ